MERLQRVCPDRFPDGLLRTLQRRVREWRHVMAQSLINIVQNGNAASEKPVVVGAEVKQ
jgi:hypothetical protein